MVLNFLLGLIGLRFHSGTVVPLTTVFIDTGGGGGPPMDPELVKANVKSMGYQDQMIQQIMRNSDEMLPIQKEQLQFGLQTAKTAYGQSQEDRTWMLGRRGMLSDVQDKVAAEAKNFNEADRRGELVAQGNADIEMASSNARSAGMRSASRRGMSANSVAEAFARQGTGMATAKAQAAFMARNAARAEGMQLTDRAGNMLAGYPAMASGATGAGAGFGASGLGMANSGLAGMNSGYGAAGTTAGQMGQNANSAQANYVTANNAANAQQGEMFGTLLGAGATMY